MTKQPANQSHSRLARKKALQKGFSRLRRQLSPRERLLSRFWHQPLVEGLSGALIQTIARPLSLATGAGAAWLGSLYLLWNARQHGSTYDYLMVLVVFLVGFTLGLLVELILTLLGRTED
jgi:hypothetical protein